MRGLPNEGTRDGVSPLADVEKLVVEGRYGRADVALRRLEALIPGLAQSADDETLLLALYGRALLSRGSSTQTAIAACDVLERAAHERQHEVWVATACAVRARYRVDSGDIGGATADLARADSAEQDVQDLSGDTGYRLLDGLALVYAGLRLNDRADEVRTRIEAGIEQRRVLDAAQHWSTWSGELAARAMEPLAGGAQEPEHELMGRAVEIAAKLDGLPQEDVPTTLRRGARGVRALSAAYRGRPSEALRLLGPDAFGTVGDLPLVERQIVSLAAMRAHALVGSLATARSLDDAATTAPATLSNLVLEVCRTRERLWLETYAGGDVIPVLHRMTELLVRLGWRGMDLVADTARQALEHQALRTESRTDALTGVGNRRALDEELRQLLRFGPLPLALILVDIDHFKEVNDRFTHVIGDEVLRRVAASLSLQLRTDDQLLRYGGDEFVVLLPGTGDEEANAVAERMAAAVAARPWNELAGELHVTLTTGVAAVWSLSGRRPDADAEKLFRRADERLLHAKRERPEGSRRAPFNPHPTSTVDDVPSLPHPASPPAAVEETPVVAVVRTRASHAAPPAAELVGEVPADLGPAPDSEPAPEPTSGPTSGPGSTSGSESSTAWTEPDTVDVTALLAGRTTNPATEELVTEEPVTEEPVTEPVAAERVAEEPATAEQVAVESVAVESVTAEQVTVEPVAVEPVAVEPAAGHEGPERRSRRAATRAAMRPGGGAGRRPGTAFDPDPDVDLDAEASPDPVTQVAHRREAPSHGRADSPRSRDAGPGLRSRREARVANRSENEPSPGTSAGRAAAEMEAAAREVGRAEMAEAEAARERAAARQTEAHERQQAELRRAGQETAAQERAAREHAERERADRERAERERAERERAAHEQTAHEQVAHEEAAREEAAQEQAARETAQEQVAQEQAAHEQAARERTEQERREQQRLEQERLEQARQARERAGRERLARELAERERVEQERIEQERQARETAEREMREAEARSRAERARAVQRRRESEQRAATRIREEAYARAAAAAKAAEQSLAEERERSRSRAWTESQELVQSPALRRAPLTDTNLFPDYVDADDTAETKRVVDPPAEPPTPLPEATQDPEEAPTRPRRDPFGPPTSRQAIIDLSSRKRPRNPYSP